MAEHTPGPWEVKPEECDRPYIRIRGTSLGHRYKIANVLTPAYEGVDARESDETRANARLIAAAPALLEACEMALRVVQNPASTQLVQHVDRCRMVYAMQAAIAAATDAKVSETGGK